LETEGVPRGLRSRALRYIINTKGYVRVPLQVVPAFGLLGVMLRNLRLLLITLLNIAFAVAASVVVMCDSYIYIYIYIYIYMCVCVCVCV